MSVECYTLTARHQGARSTLTIEANSDLVPGLDKISEQEALDFDATTTAIMRVMNLACKDDLWAKGAVELARSDGTVIHTMEAQ